MATRMMPPRSSGRILRASKKLGAHPPVHRLSEAGAEPIAQDAHEEGHDADGGKGPDKAAGRCVARAGVGDAYGKGVDAGGDGQKKGR